MVGGNSVRATGGMNAGKTVYQDENEFGESAGVEKTLKTAAEKYADNETITALAATVAEQWAAYQANPTGYFDICGADGAGHHDRRQGSSTTLLWWRLSARTVPMPSTGWMRTASPCTAFPALAALLSSASIALWTAEGKTLSVGSYMIPLLQENCEKAGVQILLNTTANEILTDANGAAVRR